MHIQAMKCVARARELLATGDNEKLPYATLEMRMAIEHLFYELTPMYAKELPADVLKSWKPADLMREIMDCHPDAEQDVRNVAVWTENPDGSRGPAVSLGGQTAVTRSLIREHWQKLGGFLHAPVDTKPHKPEKIREKVEAAIAALDKYAGDRVMINLADKVEVTCDLCNHTFQRRTSVLRSSPEFQCRGVIKGQRCPTMFAAREENGEWLIEDIQRTIPCPSCSVENHFPIHAMAHGQKLICCECESPFILELTWRVGPEKTNENHDRPKSDDKTS